MKFLNLALFERVSPAWRARLGVTLAAGLVLGAAATWLPLKRLEWLTEDLRLRGRVQAGGSAPTGEVVLVGVDIKSLHELSQWPFLRSIHGQLIDWLGRTPASWPSVFAWDVLFTEESFDVKVDQMFTDPLARREFPVIMGAQFDDRAGDLLVVSKGLRSGVPERLAPPLATVAGVLTELPDQGGGQVPIPQLLEVTRFAFLNADADQDGIVRRFHLVVRIKDRIYPSLALATMMAHLQVGPEAVEVIPGEAVVIKAKEKVMRVPIDEDGIYTLNYRHELRSKDYPDGVKEISYADLYDTLMKRVELGIEEPLPDMAGKIVVLGQTAVGLSDIGPSPLAGQSAKVLVHFNTLENMLRGDYLRHASVWPGLVLLLSLGLGAAWVLDKRRGVYVVVVPALAVAFTGGSLVLLIAGNLMVPLAVPLLAFAGQQAFVTTLKIREEQAQRDRIRKMFGSYVSPELVRRMVDARAEPQLGGHDDEITAFFSDIQGFSAFSEVLPAADLVVLLNDYLGAMTDILQDSGGALDKYIGDAIVAMFGGLVPLPDHARRACEVTAKMQMRQAELREKWKAQGNRWPSLVHAMRTRIGLNSGVVVVGNMGSHHRFNYTMMGDAVNLAARCESGAKTFGAYAVATGTTVSKAKAAGCECVFRALDCIVVKGRREPVEIFEIVALSPAHLPEGATRCLEFFEKGRAHYLKQEWDEALTCFAEAAPLEPLQPGRDEGVEANPSLLMQERCRDLRDHPPGAEWDGIYRMKTK